MVLDTDIRLALDLFTPITLQEMSAIRLMNRTDTKYVTTKTKLMQLLKMAGAEYYAQAIDGQRVAAYHTTDRKSVV